MKDQQITQLSILGVVSIVGLIAAIGLLSTPTTTPAMGVNGGEGQQGTVVGQQGFWDSFGDTPSDNTPSEDTPMDEQNSPTPQQNNNENSRFNTAQGGIQNPLTLNQDVKSVIEETEQLLTDLPRSDGIETYTLPENPSASELNQVIQMGGDQSCEQAISIYNDINAPKVGLKSEDMRALSIVTTILDTALSEGDCWLYLIENQVEESSFSEVPQNTESLTDEQEQTVKAQIAVTALKTGKDAESVAQEQGVELESIRKIGTIVNNHRQAKEQNKFIANELSDIDLSSEIRNTAFSETKSTILGLSEDSDGRASGMTPERLGIKANWQIWDNQAMKEEYHKAYDKEKEGENFFSLIGGIISGRHERGDSVSWEVSRVEEEEMRQNYPRSPTLGDTQREILIELSKKGFNPSRVLERKWSLTSGDTFGTVRDRSVDQADGLLDPNNKTIWLRSPEGTERVMGSTTGAPVFRHELVHFLHFNLGVDKTEQVIQRTWNKITGASDIADREDYPSEINHREDYEDRPHENLARQLQSTLEPEDIADTTLRQSASVNSEEELSKRIFVALIDEYLQDKDEPHPQVQRLMEDEIREKTTREGSSSESSTTTASIGGEDSTGSSSTPLWG